MSTPASQIPSDPLAALRVAPILPSSTTTAEDPLGALRVGPLGQPAIPTLTPIDTTARADAVASVASVVPSGTTQPGMLGQVLDAVQRQVVGGLRAGLPLQPAVASQVDNVLAGVRQGSLLLPDATYDPEQPSTAFRLVGTAIGAIGEGFGAETALARGLVYLTKVGGPIARGAEKALRLFGQQPDASFARRAFGGAALGATTEAGLRVGTGQTDDLLTSVGLVAAPGFVLGAAGSAVQRGLPLVREAATPAVARGVARVRDTVEPALRERVASAFHAPAKLTAWQEMRAKFASMRESVRDAFQFEARMQSFVGFEGDPRFTLGDEIRVLNHRLSRAERQAVDELALVVEPLKTIPRAEFSAAYDDFVDLVVFRDLQETAQKGLDTAGLSADDISQYLAELEAKVRPEVRAAADAHRMLVNAMRDDLIARGKMQGGYENYFPHHHIVQTLADAGFDDAGKARAIFPSQSPLRRPGGERAREGSGRKLVGDYVDVMHAALRRFHTTALFDEFLDGVENTHALQREALPEAVLRDLDSFGVAALPDGTRLRTYPPDPSPFFRTNVIDDASREVVEKALKESTDLPLAALPKVRDALAVGRAREIILPEPIAERLIRFREPDPLYAKSGPFAAFRRATSEWKRNTIYWGLSRFFMFQIVGDAVNALRSHPGTFLRVNARGIDSPAFRALRTIFARYGTPLISPTQISNSLAGSLLGAAGTEALIDDPTWQDRVGGLLVGAGLGYIKGTRRAAGTHANPLLARLYDEADEAGAINTGFVFSEEDIARRTLGARADLPSGRSEGRRLADTVMTLLTGKTHGDPLNFVRNFTDGVEVIQRERENWLRLAAYMQEIERGTPAKVAAKRAREALVDYGKFTDFENKFIRGGLLPFYAFYRHNIPNWWRAGLGRDVGGRGKIAFAVFGGLAAFDIAAQAWNETFFPDTEALIPPALRKQFHIILGNPATGEPYRDKRGQPIYVGAEMPYEQALELLGLARPGVIYSELLGMGIQGDESLTERALKLEEFESLPEPAKRTLRSVGDSFLSLLTPALKIPGELMTNTNWFLGAPIVPERYRGTQEQYREWLSHVAQQSLRQYRELRRGASQLEGGSFDPITSAFGLGLPVRGVNVDREIQRHLHDAMAAASRDTKSREAPLKRMIDDIIYSRQDLSTPDAGEVERVQATLQGARPEDRAALMRYYADRAYKSTLYRHWQSLSMKERADFWQSLQAGDREALIYYMGGGSNIVEDAGGVPAPSFLGY